MIQLGGGNSGSAWSAGYDASNPASQVIFPTYLVRVAANANARDVERPAILFVASLHAFEWVASEVALGYLDYLVQGASVGDEEVENLLEEAEFWFLVHGNVGGREWDDGSSGGTPGQSRGQRKNMQWEFTARNDGSGSDAESWSDSAERSGYCDFSTTGALGSGGVTRWDYWGINVENNISAVWPGWGSTSYNRTAMLRHLSDVNGTTAKTDYSGAGEVAPEFFSCVSADVFGDARCAAHFPHFIVDTSSPPLPVFLGGHPHCLRRGTDTDGITPVYGCFMADPYTGAYNENSPFECLQYVANHPTGVTDELGISHVCRRTEVSPGDFDYLLWECDTISAYDATTGGPLLAYCKDGVRSSCNFDDGVDGCATTIPNSAFAPESVHRDGQRYCSHSDRIYCAVSYYRTPCSAEYRGKRPFESIEARLLRTVGDNLPFAFVVDMHSAANTMSGTCKNTEGGCCSMTDTDIGCMGRNEDYDRVEALTNAMVAEYNDGVEAQWQSYSGLAGTLPDLLGMVFDRIDMTLDEKGNADPAGSQFPVWLSNMPTVTDDPADTDITSTNFDNGTFRGVTSFLWELGVSEPASWEATGWKLTHARLLQCSGDTDSFPEGGSAPRSSLFLENQLAGMKRMVGYLAGQAETPNVDPADVARRDLSLNGLRIHDGHGRGVQQLETRPDPVVNDDRTAVTKIPAGLWAVEVGALAGANPASAADLTGDVTLTQGNGLFPESETESVAVPAAERQPVMRRFRFEPGGPYFVSAKVEGGDACVPSTAASTCARASDKLIAKVEVVACDDTDNIPNGLDPDTFCAQGLPFADTDFECDPVTGRCRECWMGVGPQQDCPGGGFCFEGMCDDATTCWSGNITDDFESAGDAESPPTIASGEPPIVRSLHKENLIGVEQQDVDSFFAVPAASSGPVLLYRLTVDVRNMCEDDVYGEGSTELPSTGEMEELQVRVQVENPLSIFGSPTYSTLTESEDEGWVGIDRQQGLEVPIPPSHSSGLSNGRSLRIQVRNVAPYDVHSIPYSLAVNLDNTNLIDDDFHVKVWPWEKILWPMETIDVKTDPGDVISIGPTTEAVEDGYSVFFKPAVGYEDVVLRGEVQLLLMTPNGQIPTNDNGAPIAQTEPKDGGLAIPLGALNPKLGPYEVRLATTAEHLEGSVYLCSPNVDSCATFDPRTSTCGSTCTGDGYRCCADQDRNYYCSNLKGSDVMNCGACGNACDWDEKCLKGVCVKGKATSCWNTTCPEDTECVSKDFLFLRNPQCRATLVDRTWCGWFGTVCSSTQDCVLGLCLPKMNVACGLKCLGEGQTCCWVNGVEQCVDVASSWARCGSCGNACDVDELCSGGKCEPWYLVADVCAGAGNANCSRTGISCKNLLNDPENCGGCGFGCPDRGWCENGQCVVHVGEVENAH